MTPPDPNDGKERDGIRARRGRRSFALLVVLFALAGLFYAISLARVGRQLETRQPRPGPGPVP